MPEYISSEDFTSEDWRRDLRIVRSESLEALEAWRANPEHQQKFGMSGQLTQDLLGLLRLPSCVHDARQHEQVVSR